MSRSIYIHSKTTSQTLVVDNDRFSNLSQHERIHGFCSSLDLFVFWVLRLTGTAGIIKPVAKALEIHKSQLEWIKYTEFLRSPLCLLSCSYSLCRYYLSLSLRLSLSVLQFRVCVCFIWRVHDKVTMCAGCASVCLRTSPQLSAMEVWETNTHHMSSISPSLSFILKADRIVTWSQCIKPVKCWSYLDARVKPSGRT